MITVAREIRLKGMPMGKTLVGSLYKNKKKTDSRGYPIKGLNSSLSSNPGTTLNYILTNHYNWLLLGHAFLRAGMGNVVRITTFPTFSIRRWPRAPIATSGVWSSPRPSHERTLGSRGWALLLSLAMNFASLASSFEATNLIRIC